MVTLLIITSIAKQPLIFYVFATCRALQAKIKASELAVRKPMICKKKLTFISMHYIKVVLISTIRPTVSYCTDQDFISLQGLELKSVPKKASYSEAKIAYTKAFLAATLS